MTAVAGQNKQRSIQDLMERATAALNRCRYFEAERLADKAMAMARSIESFQAMARIVLPLQEARRQRLILAMDRGPITVPQEMPDLEGDLEPGCFLLQPPLVGADARRLRLAAREKEVPLAVVCREPTTSLGLWPVVAICPGYTLRTRIEPPEETDPPSIEWFASALEQLGDYAIEELDPEMDPVRRIDALLDRLNALPDHERLHLALIEACEKEATKRQSD